MSEISIIELENYHKIQLSIYNLQGQLIKQNNYINNQSIIINKNNLNPGIYFVKIKTDNGLTGIKKLIIE